MNTPIASFVRQYMRSGAVRFHMPGHKGQAYLGCEAADLTEIPGADVLYTPSGIIAESEANASAVFGTGRTCYATEGSSQCIRAMLAMVLWHWRGQGQPTILATRNAHKALLYAAALLDLQLQWLPWACEANSICAADIQPETLEQVLAQQAAPPAAIYLTSPDYLGGQCDIAALAQIAHGHGIPLLVDNAHGAYLHFLSAPQHPMDLGADLCCDSAHKTLPVLTGGAYLHIARQTHPDFSAHAKRALELFGSTSPSYLILQSLDLCNPLLAGNYAQKLEDTCQLLQQTRLQLAQNGWALRPTEPLKLTLDCAASGIDGLQLECRLREQGYVCEYADTDDLVLMVTPDNTPAELQGLVAALGQNLATPRPRLPLPLACGPRACSIREAFFAPHESIPVAQALHRICGAPMVKCPPAIPIALSGEVITAETIALLQRYHIEEIEVLQEKTGRKIGAASCATGCCVHQDTTQSSSLQEPV